jgi:hypothetical protein
MKSSVSNRTYSIIFQLHINNRYINNYVTQNTDTKFSKIRSGVFSQALDIFHPGSRSLNAPDPGSATLIL